MAQVDALPREPARALFQGARGGPGVPYLIALYAGAIPGGLALPGLALANITGARLLVTNGVPGSGGTDLVARPAGFTRFGQVFTLEGAINGALAAPSRGAAPGARARGEPRAARPLGLLWFQGPRFGTSR